MIMLSFDIEEFDTPIEYGYKIPFERQMEISVEGTQNILSLLKEKGKQATFFCTANFALHAPEIISEIIADGHEIASHGYYHSTFEPADLLKSKIELENLTKLKIYGFRMARMMNVEKKEILHAGYLYDTSLNPTFIPGRYNNFRLPRTYHTIDGLLEIPASVSPLLRIPLFWLSFHNFPFWLYCHFFKLTLRKDAYVVTYFHPWEFTGLSQFPELKLPKIITRNSGKAMSERLKKLIQLTDKYNVNYCTMREFAEQKISSIQQK